MRILLNNYLLTILLLAGLNCADILTAEATGAMGGGGSGSAETLARPTHKTKREPDYEEGCVNQAVCGEARTYISGSKILSKEDLCSDCEFARFPERFVACLFCRIPQKKYTEELTSETCLSCYSNVRKMLVNKFVPKDDPYGIQADWFQLKTHEAFREAKDTERRQFIPALKPLAVQKAILPKFNKTPYLYRGAIAQADSSLIHVWVGDINTDPADRRVISCAEKPAYVKALCDKYDIFGPETGTVISRMPENVTAIYLERNRNIRR